MKVMAKHKNKLIFIWHFKCQRIIMRASESSFSLHIWNLVANACSKSKMSQVFDVRMRKGLELDVCWFVILWVPEQMIPFNSFSITSVDASFGKKKVNPQLERQLDCLKFYDRFIHRQSFPFLSSAAHSFNMNLMCVRNWFVEIALCLRYYHN